MEKEKMRLNFSKPLLHVFHKGGYILANEQEPEKPLGNPDVDADGNELLFPELQPEVAPDDAELDPTKREYAPEPLLGDIELLI